MNRFQCNILTYFSCRGPVWIFRINIWIFSYFYLRDGFVIFNNITEFVVVLQPLPIVDVTREEEKYGNDGDKFNRFGRSFIGGVETVSTVVTSALSVKRDVLLDGFIIYTVDSLKSVWVDNLL